MSERSITTTAGVQRELGRLAEAVENAKDDRNELKKIVERVGDYVNELRSSVNSLNQTVQSMTAQVVSLNSEKCGARLDVVEAKLSNYDRIFGTGVMFVLKVILVLLATAMGGGAVVKYIPKLF